MSEQIWYGACDKQCKSEEVVKDPYAVEARTPSTYLSNLPTRSHTGMPTRERGFVLVVNRTHV
jgi:hypothetical protein